MRYPKIICLFIGLFCTFTINALTLTSTAFENGQKIPAAYTCDAGNEGHHPPNLFWSDPPANTKSFVLIMEDPDAPNGTWTHWLIFNVPPTTKQWTDNVTPPLTAVQGNNSWNQIGYRGPCPPHGEHRYFFRLYALDAWLDLPENNVDVVQLRKAMNQHVLEEAVLMGKYRKK